MPSCKFALIVSKSNTHPRYISRPALFFAHFTHFTNSQVVVQKNKNVSSFLPAIAGTTDRFFAASGVQSAQYNSGFFHIRRAAFSGLLKSRVGNIIAKASALRVNLNLDGTPIVSSSHTHPSHSQTSLLLTSSLSLGVPVPRPTQCMGGA